MHRSQSAGSMSSTFAVGPAMPALLTSTSSPPSSRSTSAKRRSTSARRETSATLWVTAGRSRRQAASAAASMSHTCTRAPCCWNVAAMARPIPAAPAVTSTRNPWADVSTILPFLDPEYPLAELEVGQQRRGGPGMGHVAAVEDIREVREGQHQIEIMLDDEDCDHAAQLV